MEDYSEYIDAYFNRTLSLEEIKQFDRRIIEDKEFAEQVAFYVGAREALKRQLAADKKEWFRQLANTPNQSEGGATIRQLWIYRVAAVAAVVVLVSLGWYFFIGKAASPQRLADAYIQKNFKTLSVTMGTIQDSIQDGLRWYNKGVYDSARRQFESIIERDTTNYLAKQYAGIVYLRLDNYDKALDYFRQLGKYSLYSNPAIFYQALTLLKRNKPGDKQEARQLLQQAVQQHLYGEETARRLLGEL